jgi:RHS repeat-associated protein
VSSGGISGFNGVRCYDSQIAHFISRDAAGLAGGLNPYAHAGNDPKASQ